MKQRQKDIELKYTDPWHRSSSRKKAQTAREPTGRQLYAKYQTANGEKCKHIPNRLVYDDNEKWVQEREDKLHELRKRKIDEETSELQKQPTLNKKFNSHAQLASFEDRQKAFLQKKHSSKTEI